MLRGLFALGATTSKLTYFELWRLRLRVRGKMGSLARSNLDRYSANRGDTIFGKNRWLTTDDLGAKHERAWSTLPAVDALIAYH